MRKRSACLNYKPVLRYPHLLAIGTVFSVYLASGQTPTPIPAPTFPTPEVDYYRGGPPHPTHDEFFSRITYPYHAPPEQQHRIERAARVLHIGSTEPQVIKLLGEPNYKAPWYHAISPPQRFVLDEVWCYVHSVEQPPRYDRPGQILCVSLSNRSKPRRVIAINRIDLPRRGK